MAIATKGFHTRTHTKKAYWNVLLRTVSIITSFLHKRLCKTIVPLMNGRQLYLVNRPCLQISKENKHTNKI